MAVIDDPCRCLDETIDALSTAPLVPFHGRVDAFPIAAGLERVRTPVAGQVALHNVAGEPLIVESREAARRLARRDGLVDQLWGGRARAAVLRLLAMLPELRLHHRPASVHPFVAAD